MRESTSLANIYAGRFPHVRSSNLLDDMLLQAFDIRQMFVSLPLYRRDSVTLHSNQRCWRSKLDRNIENLCRYSVGSHFSECRSIVVRCEQLSVIDLLYGNLQSGRREGTANMT